MSVQCLAESLEIDEWDENCTEVKDKNSFDQSMIQLVHFFFAEKVWFDSPVFFYHLSFI